VAVKNLDRTTSIDNLNESMDYSAPCQAFLRKPVRSREFDGYTGGQESCCSYQRSGEACRTAGAFPGDLFSDVL
jgi:hypothetical protein